MSNQVPKDVPLPEHLQALAAELKTRLPSVVPEYGRGREHIGQIVAELLDVDAAKADELVTELTERGVLRYNMASRTIGVPGHWEVQQPEPPVR